MASGWELKEGKYEERNISEDEMWGVFSYVFSSQTKNTTSYKFGFLKALLDNLYNTDDNLILSFEQIFSRFAEEYWNLVLKYQLRQSGGVKLSALENTLYKARAVYDFPEGVPFENLPLDIRNKVISSVKRECCRYVVGATFADTKGLFYSFSLKGEWLQFNPEFYRFVCRHKTVIEKLNYYEWAKYLERVNEENPSSNILLKIDESSRRNNLDYYRDILYRELECHTCFYCGKTFRSPDGVHVDHFIPWSFLKDDNLWNFVLACPHCNTSKNDKLAPKYYLDTLQKRNTLLVGHQKDMMNYKNDKLPVIYDWAWSNGYNEVWEPKVSYRA